MPDASQSSGSNQFLIQSEAAGMSANEQPTRPYSETMESREALIPRDASGMPANGQPTRTCSQNPEPSAEHLRNRDLLSSCLRHFDKLPGDAVGTGNSSLGDQVAKSFYAGMYSHGVTGLRATVKQFPDHSMLHCTRSCSQSELVV